MENHEQVKQEDQTRLTYDWRGRITISDKYMVQSDELLQVISESENVWDGHLDRFKTVRHRIRLTSRNVCTVNSAPFRASSRARQFIAKEIQKMV